jgi:hypothetical protein
MIFRLRLPFRSLLVAATLAAPLVAAGQADSTSDAPKAPIVKPHYFTGAPVTGECELGARTSWQSIEIIVAGTRTCGGQHYYLAAVEAKAVLIPARDLSLSRDEMALLNTYSRLPDALERAVAQSKQMMDDAAAKIEQANAEAAAKKQAARDAFTRELAGKKKKGLALVSATIEENEYVDATAFVIRVLNPTDKVIKYLTFTVVGYNAVGDPVIDRLRRKPRIEVKGIGPIEPLGTASYEWKFMWHTKIVDSFAIPEIKVEYMDKSVRVLKDWKGLVLDPTVIANLPEAD